MVLIILALGIVGYFVWNRWWPERPEFLQNRALKSLCVVGAIVIVAHIASPIADLIRPQAAVTAQPASVDQKKAP
jgi:heme/copper-type cytochrome/quinol oxidase subunit 2